MISRRTEARVGVLLAAEMRYSPTGLRGLVRRRVTGRQAAVAGGRTAAGCWGPRRTAEVEPQIARKRHDAAKGLMGDKRALLPGTWPAREPLEEVPIFHKGREPLRGLVQDTRRLGQVGRGSGA